MDQNIYKPTQANLEETPATGANAPALWNPDAVGNWCLLFSPVFGATLSLKNWIAIGDQQQIASAKGWLIASIVVFVLGLFFPPFMLIYLIVWYLAANRPQAKFIQQQWGKAYPRKSWGAPLGIAFGILVSIWMAFFGLALLLGAAHW
ncbi:hypothetical protein IGB42_04055 [Andreprevotia sp. IGB-42]|nr:hypothetical protein IGB42_04055 [Andreprevotia sp. IGB-42]